jgi:hypothetical protein
MAGVRIYRTSKQCPISRSVLFTTCNIGMVLFFSFESASFSRLFCVQIGKGQWFPSDIFPVSCVHITMVQWFVSKGIFPVSHVHIATVQWFLSEGIFPVSRVHIATVQWFVSENASFALFYCNIAVVQWFLLISQKASFSWLFHVQIGKGQVVVTVTRKNTHSKPETALQVKKLCLG